MLKFPFKVFERVVRKTDYCVCIQWSMWCFHTTLQTF